MAMNPSEIARETLKRLAMQRTPPTPDNYRTLYHEIAGTREAEAFPERTLKGIAAGLPRSTSEQTRFTRQLDNAIADKSWDGLRSALGDLLGKASVEPLNWSPLIREIVLRIGSRQSDVTPARKREALEHVLASSAAPDLLYTRLQGLLKNWSQAAAFDSPNEPGALDATVPPAPTSAALEEPAAGQPGAFVKGIGGELLNLFAQLLESSISVLLADNQELTEEAARLAAAARGAKSGGDVASFIAGMKRFSYRLQFVAEDQTELKSGLMHLLRLVIDNINELVLDDHWLQGQIAVVLDLVSQPPSLRRIDDVERRMKDVIFKQGALKQNLREAQDQIKQMLASFVDRLTDFSTSTNEYHDKIGACAEKIGKARDISELTGVLTEVMHETRAIQLNAQRSHDELVEMRSKVADAEREVQRLQDELANASQMVRHDPLTGALNRKGMNDAIETEVARVHRQRGSKLCLALLDIDNFKKLNDTMGHAAGDAALVHLAKVVKETIRPEDTLARYGGEEFVVLLPNTPLESAVTAMTRVQRELTRRFFLHDNEKVLITFSCGVAELDAEENGLDAVKRADGAMYLAKRAGKNRVLAA